MAKLKGGTRVYGSFKLDGGLYDANNQVGSASSILVSTGAGVSWTSPFSAGLQGTQGSQGLQGIQGVQGVQSAQGVQGLQGTQGVQGVQGLQGRQGTQGLQGLQGTQGAQGVQSAQGSQGLQGIQGVQGVQSAQGSQGVQNAQGTQGLQGTQGITGANAGFAYTFSTTTTAADPGSGFFRFNSAVTGSITEMYISDLDITGTDRSSALITFDDTPGTDRARIYLPGASTGYTVSITVTGAITDNTTWLTIPVSFTSGALPQNNDIRNVIGVRNGLQGLQGTQGVQGVQSAQGSQGLQGTQGVQGLQSAQGVQGPAGSGVASTSITAYDTTAVTTLYPVMVSATGSATTAFVRSTATALSFNASTNILSASEVDITASGSANNSVLYLTGTPTSASGTNGLLGIGALNFSDTDIIASFAHSVNSYAQLVVQNKNSGASSSADIIVNNDRAAGTTYYGDFGINGTTFAGGGVFGDVDGTYLYSAGGTLSLGSLNANAVKIATNSTERIRVLSTGQVGIGSTIPTSNLTINATAVPTNDVVYISNTGFPATTAGVNNLQIDYVGGAAAVEAGAVRVGMTPGATSGGTWNSFRILPTAAASGVVHNAVKCDSITAGVGTDNALWVGTGWDNIINYNNTSIINGVGQFVGTINTTSGISTIGFLSATNINASGISTLTTLRVTGAFQDSTGSQGSPGQILQSTGSNATTWVTASSVPAGGRFDTSIDNALYVQPTGTLDIVGVGTTVTQITTFPAGSNEYVIHSMHVTNVSNGDAEITAGFVMNARKVPAAISVSVGSSGGAGIHTFTVGSASSIRVGMAVTGTGNIGETTGIGSTAGFQYNTYVTSVDGNNITLSKPMSGRATGTLQFSPVSLVSSRLPVPVGSAVELLKQPMVLGGLDSIVLQSTGAGTGIGSTSTNAITQAANSNFLTVTAGAAITNFLASGMLITPTGSNTGIQTNTFVGVGYIPGALSVPMTKPATVSLASTSLSFTEVVTPQDGALQVTVVYQSSTDTSYQNGTGTVVGIVTLASLASSRELGITSTTPSVYYGTGFTYPSVIQSIRVSNISDGIIYPGGDYPVSVGIGNSDTIFSWLAYNMVIPRNSSIELCEAPKRIGIGQSIFAFSNTPNAIEIQVAGKQKI